MRGDEIALLEQHDRSRRVLLEGEALGDLEQHVAGCAVCGSLAADLARLDESLHEVPDPRPELFEKILRRARTPEPGAPPAEGATAGTRPVPGRVEMLCPPDTASAEAAARYASLVPLVLAVEADRHTSDPSPSRPIQRIIIVGRYPILVGRGPDMDVTVWDRSVSRRHAELDWRDDVWTVRDLESTNGTRVNGVPLGPSEVRTLAAGDNVDFGFYARLTVRSLLTVLHPTGVVADVQRLVAQASRSTSA
jgi:hypothetical protein